jgi:peptidoglycan biosynthesis protein MviN/MurJ (putative lipid II flippase)
MSGPPVIYATAMVAAVLALTLWFGLARGLRRSGRSGWRAAPLGALLLFAAIGYGLYWFAFFSSPRLAILLHLIQLKVAHKLGGLMPLLAAGGLACGLAPLVWPRVGRGPAA